MVENILRAKYDECLDGLDIYENKTSVRLSKIVIKQECRNKGIGTKIMYDLIEYSDNNDQIIVLSPASDFGGNKNRLIQFYKRFGFKQNKGYHKNFQFQDSMIRYPKLNETIKPLIKSLLREGLNAKNEYNPYIDEFVKFAIDYFGVKTKISIKLQFNKDNISTTAVYDTRGYIYIYIKNRALVDILRSIGHELTHHFQMENNRITDTINDGSDGSPIENEANAEAGILIRKFGKLHPEIYSI